MRSTISEHTDEALMVALQAGNEAAFNQLYQRYSRRILYFLYRMLGQDEAKAQDLLQDVFLKLVEAPEKFDPKRSFKTWIFTVTANVARNYFRAQQSKASLHQEWQAWSSSSLSNIDLPLFYKKLQLALEDLSPAQRETFILRYREGFSQQEIAAILDCPLGTIKSRCNKTLSLLAKALKPYQHLFQS